MGRSVAPRAARIVARAAAYTSAGLLIALAAACGDTSGARSATASAPPGASATDAKHYTIIGQILVVNANQQSLAIKHEDIVGYMPAMTMTFPVAKAALMQDRVPGELIKATLEVDANSGKIVEITHTGNAPLPDKNNIPSLAIGVLEPGDDAPDAALVDIKNVRRSFSEWKGQPTLITFIYTRCPLPNFCPLMDRNFVAIQKQGEADPVLRGKFKLVSVSFDPEFDTPAVMKAHGITLGADPAVWSLLTGDRIAVEKFAARFGVGVIREGSGPGDITHNLRTALIGADGKILKIYPGSDWATSTVIADLRAAVTAPKK